MQYIPARHLRKLFGIFMAAAGIQDDFLMLIYIIGLLMGILSGLAMGVGLFWSRLWLFL